MKRFLLLFIFWFSLVGGVSLLLAGEEKYEDTRERIEFLSSDKPEILIAVVDANRAANISLQQHTSVHVNSILRRYPQFRTNGERSLISFGTETYRLVSCYQAAYNDFRNCNALLKQAGYYLYSLCRLII